MSEKNKILVILGPTATGKSSLAVKLAKKYNGEIVSADSRQVYKGLDIGTGKITKKEMCGIPHHMLDVISPKKVFSVSEWNKQTKKIITDIITRKKLPIICGGTGFYIQSIVDNIILPGVPPNKILRKKLGKYNLESLQRMLAKLDPRRFSNIDIKNRVRLIRAIEIATKLGQVPLLKPMSKGIFDIVQIGLTLPKKELKKKIHVRLLSRIREGMIKEARSLHHKGLSLKRMEELGLEYRYLAFFLQNKLTGPEFLQKLETEIWHYARRQNTWFKRDKTIKWFHPIQTRDILKQVKSFVAR
jgi:tRNA dimethylallyltransferase